jgi:hypothetical protein
MVPQTPHTPHDSGSACTLIVRTISPQYQIHADLTQKFGIFHGLENERCKKRTKFALMPSRMQIASSFTWRTFYPSVRPPAAISNTLFIFHQCGEYLGGSPARQKEFTA